MKRKRHLQRKRDLAAKRDTTDYMIHAQAPHYDFLKNDTCLLFPETTQGPYYFPRSEILRQDMREGQPGIETELDISLIDVNTCEPLEGALISLWVSYISNTGVNFWTDRDRKALQRHWILQLICRQRPEHWFRRSGQGQDWRGLLSQQHYWIA